MPAFDAATEPFPNGMFATTQRELDRARLRCCAARDAAALTAGATHAGAHINTASGPSPSASQPVVTIASRTARLVV